MVDAMFTFFSSFNPFVFFALSAGAIVLVRRPVRRQYARAEALFSRTLRLLLQRSN
jgi:hypothetical protein